MMLSNELRSILDQAGQSFRPGHKPDSSNVQLLLCGDFNSLPDSGKEIHSIRYFYVHLAQLSRFMLSKRIKGRNSCVKYTRGT